MTATTVVRPALWLALPVLRAAADSLWTAPRMRERYPRYLAVMHWIIRASVPLMQVAADICAELPPADASAAPLAEYYTAHATEEWGHDEWILSDLAAMGAPEPDELLDPVLRQDVAAMVGAQYYWIRHYHPACLLGYIMILEGCPPDAAIVRQLPALTGWPASAFRTLAGHAVLDPGHMRDLIRLVDWLPLSAAVTDQVARNAADTAARASLLLRRLAEDAS